MPQDDKYEYIGPPTPSAPSTPADDDKYEYIHPPQAKEQGRWSSFLSAPNLVRMGGSTAADIIGGLTGPFYPAVSFGGGALSEGVARWMEGKPFDPAIMAVEGAMNLAPGPNIPGRGAGLKELAKFGAKSAGYGAAQGLAGSVPRHLAEEGTLLSPSEWTLPSGEEALGQTVVGGIGGGVVGTALGAGHMAYRNRLPDIANAREVPPPPPPAASKPRITAAEFAAMQRGEKPALTNPNTTQAREESTWPKIISARRLSTDDVKMWRSRGYITGPPDTEGFTQLVPGPKTHEVEAIQKSQEEPVEPTINHREGEDLPLPTKQVTEELRATMRADGYQEVVSPDGQTTTFTKNQEIQQQEQEQGQGPDDEDDPITRLIKGLNQISPKKTPGWGDRPDRIGVHGDEQIPDLAYQADEGVSSNRQFAENFLPQNEGGGEVVSDPSSREQINRETDIAPEGNMNEIIFSYPSILEEAKTIYNENDPRKIAENLAHYEAIHKEVWAQYNQAQSDRLKHNIPVPPELGAAFNKSFRLRQLAQAKYERASYRIIHQPEQEQMQGPHDELPPDDGGDESDPSNVLPFGPTRDKYQEIANARNVTMGGVRPEKGIPIIHDPRYGGFQSHLRGNEEWVTHPMFPDEPHGPFMSPDEAVDWIMSVQDSPEFAEYVRQKEERENFEGAPAGSLIPQETLDKIPPDNPNWDWSDSPNYVPLDENKNPISGPRSDISGLRQRQIFGQQELPLGPHSEFLPREDQSPWRPQDYETPRERVEPHQQDLFENPQDEQQQQMGQQEDDDEEILRYLQREDARPPEMEDLSNVRTLPPRNPENGQFETVKDAQKRVEKEIPQEEQEQEMGMISNAFKKGPNDEPSTAEEVVGLTTNLPTTGDLSAPLRQGLPQVFTKEWWSAIGPMLRAFADPKYAAKVEADLNNLPTFQRPRSLKTGKRLPSIADQAGLDLIGGTRVGKSLGNMVTTWAETGKFLGPAAPLYSSTVGKYVRASNRAYATFLNHLRANTFERLMNNGRDMSTAALSGKSVREGFLSKTYSTQGATDINPFTNKIRAKEIADYVNTATGSGPLKGHVIPVEGTEINLEKAAGILRWTMFSPKLVASRMRMLSPATYIMASPMVRKQYLKSALGTGMAWLTVTQLARLANQAGITDAEIGTDPNSADFGKVLFPGGTRLDPGGGFQQFLVALSRMITGHVTSSSKGNDRELGAGFRAETRKDVLERFAANKLNPIMKFAYDLLDASERTPFHVGDRVAQMFVPLVHQDMIELMKENPSLLPIIMPAATLGMGTQTYDQGESVGKLIPEENDYLFQGGEFLPEWLQP